ncbi:MAG: hypothetical protein ACK5C0_02030 [Candidatus Kapaibacterium sp.]|jgi:hypothetical protein
MNISLIKGRTIFLVDAIGAFVSAISLLVPYLFKEVFGMPQSILTIFITIAIAYSLYSITVYLSNTPKWKSYLLIIALLNIGYCLFTMYHVFNNMNTITLYGYLYFVGEILIILTLSGFELRLSGAEKQVKVTEPQ